MRTIMEENTLATELLMQLKASAKRWFIAFVIMVMLEVCTIVGFMWYLSLPVEQAVAVENEDGNANYIEDSNTGDINNGSDNKNNPEGSSK